VRVRDRLDAIVDSLVPLGDSVHLIFFFANSLRSSFFFFANSLRSFFFFFSYYKPGMCNCVKLVGRARARGRSVLHICTDRSGSVSLPYLVVVGPTHRFRLVTNVQLAPVEWFVVFPHLVQNAQQAMGHSDDGFLVARSRFDP